MKALLRNSGIPLKSFNVEVVLANTVPGILNDWQARHLSWDHSHRFAITLGAMAPLIGLRVRFVWI
jgi:hypothetical protein